MTVPLGSATRRQLDTREAERVDHLQELLVPQTLVRISRVQPVWAEGYIEHYELDEDEGYAELFDYIQGEHGGRKYRIEVLSSDGRTLLYSGKMRIAGPVRVGGAIATRESFEGAPEQRPLQHAVVSNPARGGNETLDIIDRVMKMQGGGNDKLAAVLDNMSKRQTEMLREFTEKMNRAPNPIGGTQTLDTLLDGVVETSKKLERVRAALGGGSQGDGDEPDDDKASDDESMIKTFGKQILTEAVRNQMGQQQPAAAVGGGGPTGQLRRVVLQPKTQQQSVAEQSSANGVEAIG